MTYAYWCLQCRSFVGDAHFTQTGHGVHCIPSEAVQATRADALKDAADRACSCALAWLDGCQLSELMAAILAGGVKE